MELHLRCYITAAPRAWELCPRLSCTKGQRNCHGKNTLWKYLLNLFIFLSTKFQVASLRKTSITMHITSLELLLEWQALRHALTSLLQMEALTGLTSTALISAGWKALILGQGILMASSRAHKLVRSHSWLLLEWSPLSDSMNVHHNSVPTLTLQQFVS